MTKFLITGGAGFIGSHIVDALVESGHSVRVVDNLSTGRLENIATVRNKIDFKKMDICDVTELTKLMTGMDYVIHQAALPSVPRSIQDPVLTNRNNIDGTLSVLTAAKDAGVKRVICASSSSVYGADPTIPKREDLPAKPQSPYALTKLTGEMYARMFFTLYGLETVSLRYFNVFGPRQNPNSQYAAVIPIFIDRLTRNAVPVIHSDGNQSRDFTFVKNVVQANLSACSAPDAAGYIFNIGCGRRITINELYAELCDLLGYSTTPRYDSGRPGDVRHSLADISLARSHLGYSPEIDVHEGLQITVDAFDQKA